MMVEIIIPALFGFTAEMQCMGGTLCIYRPRNHAPYFSWWEAE